MITLGAKSRAAGVAHLRRLAGFPDPDISELLDMLRRLVAAVEFPNAGEVLRGMAHRLGHSDAEFAEEPGPQFHRRVPARQADHDDGQALQLRARPRVGRFVVVIVSYVDPVIVLDAVQLTRYPAPGVALGQVLEPRPAATLKRRRYEFLIAGIARPRWTVRRNVSRRWRLAQRTAPPPATTTGLQQQPAAHGEPATGAPAAVRLWTAPGRRPEARRTSPWKILAACSR